MNKLTREEMQQLLDIMKEAVHAVYPVKMTTSAIGGDGFINCKLSYKTKAGYTQSRLSDSTVNAVFNEVNQTLTIFEKGMVWRVFELPKVNNDSSI